jgi:hypothetical protein
MRPPRDRTAYLDRSLLLFLLGLFLLVSPLKPLWANADIPWYSVYLLWAGIIALAYGLQCRNHDDL